jgi:transposase
MGWSIRGDPCRVRQSARRSKRWSILPAITILGYIAYEIYQDSFTTTRFNAFIIHDLLPIMNPFPERFSVLVMDNHSIHRSEELREACQEKGIHLLFLPAYSPDMNPIEQSFSQLKSWMRRNQPLAQAMEYNFESFIRIAIRSMTERDCQGHFARCGYATRDWIAREDNRRPLFSENSESDSE